MWMESVAFTVAIVVHVCFVSTWTNCLEILVFKKLIKLGDCLTFIWGNDVNLLVFVKKKNWVIYEVTLLEKYSSRDQ